MPIELILLRQCASYLAMPIWLMAENGDLLFYNEPAESVLGRRFDEAGEMPGAELAAMFQTTAEDGSPLEANDLPVNIALTERRPAHRRMRIRGLDGAWRKIEVTAFPVEGQGGRHLGAVAIFWEAHDK
ncbi:MAG: PAS domain-containing protein [Chloroflexi bacterium]|nr:PAS domain-containing protein [Chloroflexota bacterium]